MVLRNRSCGRPDTEGGQWTSVSSEGDFESMLERHASCLPGIEQGFTTPRDIPVTLYRAPLLKKKKLSRTLR